MSLSRGLGNISKFFRMEGSTRKCDKNLKVNYGKGNIFAKAELRWSVGWEYMVTGSEWVQEDKATHGQLALVK